MTTDSDMRNQVCETLGAESADFDVTAIVDDIQRAYGTVDVGTIPSDAFWTIVERHAI